MSIAIVFPGQGSQSIGMLSELAAGFGVVGDTFTEASDILGYDLWALIQSGPAEKLADTRFTQPAMFVSDIAVWRVLQANDLPAPTVMAGHSLGEFAALVAAGALEFADGCVLVQRRAELMAAAVPDGEGGMAALLGMDDDAVIALCESMTGERIVEAVNFNAPGQVAISGHVDALENTVAAAKDHGARRAVMLPVSVPNHSSLMRGAGESLVHKIDALSWQPPAVPVVQNADASAPGSLDELLARLRRHVYNPVQWTRSIEHIRDQFGVTLVMECGPGKVLTGLGKRIDRSLKTLPVEDAATLQAALEAAVEAAGDATA